MKKAVTIKDIATKLGVHHTTVSLALRNSPNIKPETRELVQNTAREMNYQPNMLAQSFRNKSSKTLGVIVPNVHHFMFSEFISIFSDLAFHEGYSLMVGQSNENLEYEKQNVEAMLNNRVAGIVAAFSHETTDFSHFVKIQEYGVPLVFFDRVPDNFRACKVSVDNFGAAFQGVELLLNQNRRLIAHINGQQRVGNVQGARLAGYRQSLVNSGLPIRQEFEVFTGYSVQDGILAAQQLLNLQQRPDAVFAAGAELAVGAIKFFKENNIRIPEDIAVVGFDNPPIAEASDPELTTLAQPLEEMAASSFRLLLQQINDELAFPEHIILQANLIKRRSA
jgi:DNA-binding LacI/PurR family transcriptional regulator